MLDFKLYVEQCTDNGCKSQEGPHGAQRLRGSSSIRKKTKLKQFKMKLGFPWWLSGKESTCNEGLILESGRSPGGGHGNPLHYRCLENPMDRGAWWATVRGVARVRKTTMMMK